MALRFQGKAPQCGNCSCGKQLVQDGALFAFVVGCGCGGHERDGGWWPEYPLQGYFERVGAALPGSVSDFRQGSLEVNWIIDNWVFGFSIIISKVNNLFSEFQLYQRQQLPCEVSLLPHLRLRAQCLVPHMLLLMPKCLTIPRTGWIFSL